MTLLTTRFDNTDASAPTISLEDQTRIVKLVSLCSRENPDNRQLIGTFRDSVVLKATVSLIDIDIDIDDEGGNNNSLTAAVGDAIWILSFANQHNHEYFVEHDAIAKMALVLVAKANALEKNEIRASDQPAAILAIMWMAAALQNLAASYCVTDSGHCWWEYEFPSKHDENDETENVLYLHAENPLVVDASHAANTIAQSVDGELVRGFAPNHLCGAHDGRRRFRLGERGNDRRRKDRQGRPENRHVGGGRIAQEPVHERGVLYRNG
jgi:hypothetical protein